MKNETNRTRPPEWPNFEIITEEDILILRAIHDLQKRSSVISILKESGSPVEFEQEPHEKT